MNKIANYLREVRAELKKVTWPTRRETMVSTLVVIASVAIITGIIWGIDIILSQLLKLII